VQIHNKLQYKITQNKDSTKKIDTKMQPIIKP